MRKTPWRRKDPVNSDRREELKRGRRGHAVRTPILPISIPLALLLPTLFASGLLSPQEGRALQASDGVALHGTIRAEGLRADSVVPGAIVEVRGAGGTRTGVADPGGRYRIEGLRGETVKVAVYHLATHPFEVEVGLPEAGDLRLDVELERRALVMPGLTVLTRPHPRSGAATRETVSARSHRPSAGLGAAAGARLLDTSTGMVESGLARGLEPSRDEQEAGPSRVLLMRGSTVDARTVFLDGAPVLTPFHVAGLVSPFEPELLDRATY
jgi:hypothetical protein